MAPLIFFKCILLIFLVPCTRGVTGHGKKLTVPFSAHRKLSLITYPHVPCKLCLSSKQNLRYDLRYLDENWEVCEET